MAVLILVVSGHAGYAEYNTLIREGVGVNAYAIMAFMFGGVFARACIDTGNVENIIKKAAELGGDRPFTSVLLMGAASAYVSTGATAGGVIVTGAITMPIMMNFGFPPLIAATIHEMTSAMLVLWWPLHWAYMGSWLKVSMNQMTPFLVAFTPIVLVVVLAYVIYEFKANRLPVRWAAPADPEAAAKLKDLVTIQQKVPAYALIGPIIPLVFILGFKMDLVLALMLGVPIVIVLTQPGSGRRLQDLGPLLSRIYLKGIDDMSMLIAITLGVGFVLRASKFPFVSAPMNESFKALTPLGFVPFILLFGFLLFFGVFRGPLQPWGMGAVTLAAILATGRYPHLGVAAMAGVYDHFAITADPTTGVVPFVCGFTRTSVIDFMKRVFWWMFAIGVLGLILVRLYYPF